LLGLPLVFPPLSSLSVPPHLLLCYPLFGRPAARSRPGRLVLDDVACEDVSGCVVRASAGADVTVSRVTLTRCGSPGAYPLCGAAHFALAEGNFFEELRGDARRCAPNLVAVVPRSAAAAAAGEAGSGSRVVWRVGPRACILERIWALADAVQLAAIGDTLACAEGTYEFTEPLHLPPLPSPSPAGGSSSSTLLLRIVGAGCGKTVFRYCAQPVEPTVPSPSSSPPSLPPAPATGSPATSAKLTRHAAARPGGAGGTSLGVGGGPSAMLRDGAAQLHPAAAQAVDQSLFRLDSVRPKPSLPVTALW